MNSGYDARTMELTEKQALARTGSMTVDACAIRVRAARYVALMEQQDLAKAGGVSKSALSNVEAGLAFPNRALMHYLFHAHRIDFNFILDGQFSQLPGDVQDALFPALERASREWDQREGSGQSRAAPTAAQSE
jgi:transcriptional regulator with XRE-family HTH domain